MGGDYTRWTFDPVKDYAEVFKQQGRVDLDADWNELAEIVNRRWRAETMDIIGRAVVPLNTKDAFLIKPGAPGNFTIGVGRMYVDGLMAECHGAPPPVYDASLGENQGSNPIPFTSQPYFPSPSPLPSNTPVTDFVYLDVWQREVTAMQDPDIREVALGGPDTATRMQTVWQVKVLPNVGLLGCTDMIPGWDTSLSAGRLTTSTVVPAPSPDPCILSPTGGYRGCENRLYRVEVHAAGTVGGVSPAKFKWSRDNGSVVSAVESISAPGGPSSVVKLKSLGRDRVLRFQAGDWVEILDDNAELAGAAGFLTKIISPPDEANRTITVSPSIPGGTFDPTVDGRHTRARRWDQRNTGIGSDVDPATGLIDATAGPLDIEDGIQVSFTDDGSAGKLHVGDYWLFAARTADASVEPLQKAPPRGILHHYARIGFITWTATGGTFADCRQFWPPSMGGDCTGCCTVTVGDGVESQGAFTDIQQAINSLGPAGGVVCLGAGVFIVKDTIHIGLNNVTVRGMGWATRIIFSPDPHAGSRVLFDIDNVSHVTLESFFAVATAPVNAETIVRIANSKICRVHDTALINLNIEPASSGAFAEAVRSGRAIELAGSCIDCEVDRNMLLAAKGIVSVAGTAKTSANITGTVVLLLSGGNQPVPGAPVTSTNQATGTAQTTTTDSDGRFSFSSVPAGTYIVKVSDQGLGAQKQVSVVAGQTVDITLALRPGGVAGIPARAAAEAVSSSPAAVSSPSNVNGIDILDNRIFALQSSIFLVKVEDCRIHRNRLLGLGQEALKQLQSTPNLDRKSIDNFQHATVQVVTNAAASIAFQGAAIVVELAQHISIVDNVFTGLVGLFSFALLDALIEDNVILAFAAHVVLIGLIIRVSGNFVAGLLAGWIQAGFLIDFISEDNFWLGLTGLLFFPLIAFQQAFSGLMTTALGKGGFAAPGVDVAENARVSAVNTGASTGALGLATIIKIQRDVFLTFSVGIEALRILSGDVIIADNTFEFCTGAGIRWSALPVSPGQPASPHAIDRNTFNITGVGIVCTCLEGVFRGNRIHSPKAGFQLRCLSGVIQDNLTTGPPSQGAATSGGQIQLAATPTGGDRSAAFQIVGNRLQNGTGHGILIATSMDDVRIQDNVIEAMAGNGISAASGASIRTVRISGNDISHCLGGGEQNAAGGAIVLPAVETDLWVHGNRLANNQGIGMSLGTFSGNLTALRLRIQDNSQDGDAATLMVLALGNAIQFNGNQCVHAPVYAVWLIGQLIVADGNTIIGPNGANLLLQAVGTGTKAIATSNILSSAVLASGFPPAQLVIANNL